MRCIYHVINNKKQQSSILLNLIKFFLFVP